MDYRIVIAGCVATALMLSCGCVSTHSNVESLEQDVPHKISKSLRIPEHATLGPVIPGLRQGAVSQGMANWPEKNLLLTSHYFDQEIPSCIVTMEWEFGKALHTVKLQEPDGTIHTGHVGGIVIASSNLWIASDAHLYRYDLDDMLTNDTAVAIARFSTEATHEVAFCSAYGDKIWAGEFALNDKYPTDPAHHLTARDGSVRHGWICGYNPEKGFNRSPDQTLSVPDRAQGMVVTDDFIFLSLSYGRRNRSSIEIFRNPLVEKPHRIVPTSKGEEGPLWFLDGKNHIRSIDLPPMAENITIINGQLAVLFESGAKKFKWFGKKPLDYIILLDLEELNP
jgi:hypothetical protein